MWEVQHELAAEKIYAMCADLGGFFLKVFERLTFSQVDFFFLSCHLAGSGKIRMALAEIVIFKNSFLLLF